jgi:two-component system LytT family sensor kinase
MRSKKRYPLLKVFWVVFTINAVLFALSLGVIKYIQYPGIKGSVDHMVSSSELIRQGISLAFQTLFFYFSLNYYNKLIVERKATIHYVWYSALLFVIVMAYFHLKLYFFPEKNISGMTEKKAIGLYIFSFIISSLFCIGISLLLAYLNNLRDEKKQRKVLEAQKMQLEIDKSQANFKFLKSQINPHFLHNTLSFLYAKSLGYSAELSEGILTLSDIMRYALNESAGNDDRAPLKDEIGHVRNVIKINQLRFSNNLHVNFEVNGIINGAQIIPFVLITIVENAFKHGDLQKAEYPIDIKLTVDHDSLYFYCRNKKKTGPKEIGTGLGLDNIRNRLDFAYGSNYKLLIKDEQDIYTTELIINKL